MLLSLGLKLLGIWGWIKRGAASLAKYALVYPREAIIVALLCLSAGLWRGNVSKDRQIANMKAEHVKVLAKIEHESAANLAAQIAQREEWEAKSEQAAKEADNAYEQGRADRGALIAAHADSVRADKVCRRNPAPAAEAPTTPPADGPGNLSGMVIVPRDEYETLAENTRRLDWIVNVWVPELEAKGVAERLPEPAFGGK